MLVYTLARKLCREAAAEASSTITTQQCAKGIASAKTVNAVSQLAAGRGEIAANVDQWDAHLRRPHTPQRHRRFQKAMAAAHLPVDITPKAPP